MVIFLESQSLNLAAPATGILRYLRVAEHKMIGFLVHSKENGYVYRQF